MVRRSAVVCLVVLCGVGGVVRGQDLPGADPADLAATLDELSAAGAPPTATEIADFLREASVPRYRSALSGRFGRQSGSGPDTGLRLNWRTAAWDVRGRWRQDRLGNRLSAATVKAGGERWELAAGQLALPHGFGLLIGGPGRGPTLTADGRLGHGTRGLLPWVGQPAPQTIQGLGAAVGGAGWRLSVLTGTRGGRTSPRGQTFVGGVARRGRRGVVSCAVLADALEQGVSLAGLYERGSSAGSFEAVWRQPVGWRRMLTAALAQAGWRPSPELRLELLAGWSDLGPRPAMGVKQPVLGDWSGRGVAVRLTWRLQRGLGIKALVHQGRGRLAVSEEKRRRQVLADVQLTASWPGGWFGEARLRTGGGETAAWSERFPWRPPVVVQRDLRQVQSLKSGWRQGHHRLQILWRRLRLGRVTEGVGQESAGARSLLSLSGTRPWGQSWLLRAGWTSAWGDPVDLVSAVVPFTGYVLPRHWGQWRSEWMLGLEWQRGPWRWRSAFSWREPRQVPLGGGSGVVRAGWLEVAMAR